MFIKLKNGNTSQTLKVYVKQFIFELYNIKVFTPTQNVDTLFIFTSNETYF